MRRTARPTPRRAELAERIAAAAAQAGIGLTLLPVFYAHATFGGAPPRAEQRRFITDLDGFARLYEECRGFVETVGVAPHSLRAATPQELAAVVALAGDGPIHIHVAEQVKEVEDCLAWSGARPVRWLLDHAEVDARWCAIHATHMDDGEARDLRRQRRGRRALPDHRGQSRRRRDQSGSISTGGGRFGIGSDFNIEIGAAAELRQLEYAQRLTRRQRNVLAPRGGSTGRALFDAAAAGGAQALRADSGRIAQGAVADLVSLDVGSPLLAGRADDEILDAWIFTPARGWSSASGAAGSNRSAAAGIVARERGRGAVRRGDRAELADA